MLNFTVSLLSLSPYSGLVNISGTVYTILDLEALRSVWIEFMCLLDCREKRVFRKLSAAN